MLLSFLRALLYYIINSIKKNEKKKEGKLYCSPWFLQEGSRSRKKKKRELFRTHFVGIHVYFWVPLNYNQKSKRNRRRHKNLCCKFSLNYKDTGGRHASRMIDTIIRGIKIKKKKKMSMRHFYTCAYFCYLPINCTLQYFLAKILIQCERKIQSEPNQGL